ncbi:MAG TPA: alpha/beta fold hydrolase [Noviherbaspirillum sp.]|nr:alpha/beta fold hydrolase [Noviherbaspirillum sp.]
MLIKVAKVIVNAAPDSLATAIACRLSGRAPRPPVSSQERDAMAQAAPLQKNAGNVAWVWGKDGPLVILVHGWGGRAAQMAPLAAHLAGLGFRCVAFDMAGHGESSYPRTSWASFLRDIEAITRSLDTGVHAYVAHSAGALTTMAARKLKGIRGRHYVCICGPSHPFPPIDVVRKKLDPRESVVERYKQHIAGQFETTWANLESGSSFAGAGEDLLLVYDKRDRFVPHTEAERIKALCPDARVIKMDGYGHVRILTAPELADAVGTFLMPARRVAGQRHADSLNV